MSVVTPLVRPQAEADPQVLSGQYLAAMLMISVICTVLPWLTSGCRHAPAWACVSQTTGSVEHATLEGPCKAQMIDTGQRRSPLLARAEQVHTLCLTGPIGGLSAEDAKDFAYCSGLHSVLCTHKAVCAHVTLTVLQCVALKCALNDYRPCGKGVSVEAHIWGDGSQAHAIVHTALKHRIVCNPHSPPHCEPLPCQRTDAQDSAGYRHDSAGRAQAGIGRHFGRCWSAARQSWTRHARGEHPPCMHRCM